jgi:hypothetical protein
VCKPTAASVQQRPHALHEPCIGPEGRVGVSEGQRGQEHEGDEASHSGLIDVNREGRRMRRKALYATELAFCTERSGPKTAIGL